MLNVVVWRRAMPPPQSTATSSNTTPGLPTRRRSPAPSSASPRTRSPLTNVP